MKAETVKSKKPEERELNKKLNELSVLESELIQRELDLSTLKAELDAFEKRYIQIVGVRYSELDEILAQIAEAEARLKPKDETLKEQARQTRAKARESAHTTKNCQDSMERGVPFQPSDDLKRLFRQVAKMIHPDLTVDENERKLRQAVMAKANAAYERGDIEGLREILEGWESSPAHIKGDGTAADLIRTIRKIAQAEARLQAINIDINRLISSSIYRLKKEVAAAENYGRDILSEMASKVEREISSAKVRLSYVIG